MIDGDENTIDFGFDDDNLFDLSFEGSNDEPADLNEADMTVGTEPGPVVNDLSGVTPTPIPVTPAAPAAPAVPAATTVPISPAAAPVAPASSAPVVPATTTEQPSATDQTPPTVNIEEFVAQNQNAIIDNLVASHFRIDDATAESLGFAPEVKSWIEKTNAKNFLLTMVQMNNALQATLPTVVANLMDVTSKVKTTHEEFFGAFSDLADKKYVPHLRQLAGTLRQLNPTLDKAAFIALLGTTARTVFGLPTPAAQQKAQPARPGVRRGQPRPFTPAGAVAPQRNPGNAPLGEGLEFMNNALRLGADD